MPPQVAPVVASHTGVCPLPANPLPGPSHPGKTGQAPSLLGSPPPKGVGRGGLREPPGSEVPGFSVPVDGNPRNTGSQVGSVWSIHTARKMCCEHWLWAQLRPGLWLRSLQEGLAGNRRRSTVRSPQRGLAAACHCLSTTTSPGPVSASPPPPGGMQSPQGRGLRRPSHPCIHDARPRASAEREEPRSAENERVCQKVLTPSPVVQEQRSAPRAAERQAQGRP